MCKHTVHIERCYHLHLMNKEGDFVQKLHRALTQVGATEYKIMAECQKEMYFIFDRIYTFPTENLARLVVVAFGGIYEKVD